MCCLLLFASVSFEIISIFTIAKGWVSAVAVIYFASAFTLYIRRGLRGWKGKSGVMIGNELLTGKMIR
jgi:hypothetical protein